MNQLELLTTEGKPFDLPMYWYKKRPCWLARDIGNFLDYAKGGRNLIKTISSQWKDELTLGQDYLILSGQELADFKKLLELDPQKGSSRAPTMTILFESGVYAATFWSKKPQSKRLRQHIYQQVAPQLARDGRYLPERHVTKEGEMIGEPLHIESFEEKKFKYQAMIDLLEHLQGEKSYPREILTAHRIIAVEQITGMDLDTLKPQNTRTDWKSPTEIGKRFGLSPQRIGRISNSLGLKGDPLYSMATIGPAKNANKTVTKYLYSPGGVKQIEIEIKRLIHKGKITPLKELP